jgi:hypothetical protein
MNNFTGILFCGLLLIVGGIAYQVAAEGNVLPVEQSEYQGIPYVSGGVGSEEREQFDAIGKNYSIKLVFAGKSGEYVEDIKVEILDSIGKKVLNAVSEGPWFFSKLPPGKYTVTVTRMGKEKQKKVTIGKNQKQTTLRFYWDESDLF